MVRIDDEAHGFAALYGGRRRCCAPLGSVFVVLLLAAFMLAERSGLRNRFIRLTGTEDLQQTTAALDDAGRRVGRMLLTQLAVNGTFRLVVGVALWLIGLPSPFLWGIFAGIMRFVPYVGAIIGLLPPLFVAFVVDPGWGSVFWTLGRVRSDRAVGRARDRAAALRRELGPVADRDRRVGHVVGVFVGADRVGAVDAAHDLPGGARPTREAAAFPGHVARRPAGAGSRTRSSTNACSRATRRKRRSKPRSFSKGRGLSTYFDEIALTAVQRAHQDIVRGSVSGERLDRLIGSAQTLIAALAVMPHPLARGGQAGAEARAAFDQVRGERDVDRLLFEPSALAPGWRGDTPIAVLHGNHPLDGLVATMLAQLLGKHGLRAAALPIGDAAQATAAQMRDVALVCLSFVEPLSTLHLRAVSLQVRRAVPQAKVLLCIWQQTDESLLAQLRAKLRVEHVVTTTSDALEAAGKMATAQRSG